MRFDAPEHRRGHTGRERRRGDVHDLPGAKVTAQRDGEHELPHRVRQRRHSGAEELLDRLGEWHVLADPQRPPFRERALHSLACTKLDVDEYGEARALFEESLALRRKLGDKRNVANSLCYLGSVALLERDYDRATVLLDESVALGRDLANLLLVSAALANESLVTLAAGDAERASTLCLESLALSHELGDRRTSVECLHALAAIAAVQAEPLRAALLSGAAESLHAEIKAPPSPAERMVGERFLPVARAAVDQQSFEAALAERRQMGYDVAVRYALEDNRT